MKLFSYNWSQFSKLTFRKYIWKSCLKMAILFRPQNIDTICGKRHMPKRDPQISLFYIHGWARYQPMQEDITYVTSSLIGWYLTQLTCPRSQGPNLADPMWVDICGLCVDLRNLNHWVLTSTGKSPWPLITYNVHQSKDSFVLTLWCVLGRTL